MGHEFKHGGGQTLVDEVAGQAALTGHKHSAQVIVSHSSEASGRSRDHRLSRLHADALVIPEGRGHRLGDGCQSAEVSVNSTIDTPLCQVRVSLC